MVTIYALKDPETRRIRYIGQTINPDKRLKQHLHNKSNGYRTNWIAKLKSRGLLPEFESLVMVPESEADKWEIKFIAAAKKLGFSLVNVAKGGAGIKRSPLEKLQDDAYLIYIRGQVEIDPTLTNLSHRHDFQSLTYA